MGSLGSQTLLLKLFNGILKLWNGGTDIGKLYDVRFGFGCQFAKLAQYIGNCLLRSKGIGEMCEDTTGQGNILEFIFNSGTCGKCSRKMGSKE